MAVTPETVTPEQMQVFSGIELQGALNTDESIIIEQVKSAIRRGHPQIQPQQERGEQIILAGSGPSLKDTLPAMVDMIRHGAKLVTVNGSYDWALKQNLKPSAQVVLDARPTSARFVAEEIPDCRYYIASQCHPSVFDAVADFENVGIFHAVANDNSESQLKEILDDYYGGHWFGIAGGSTVTTRALALLRTLGYLRYAFFGVDSCWFGDEHHAFDQPENQKDRKLKITVTPEEGGGEPKDFWCAPWHLKQAEDILQMMRFAGDKFIIQVHGEGLIAHLFRAAAGMKLKVTEGNELVSYQKVNPSK